MGEVLAKLEGLGLEGGSPKKSQEGWHVCYPRTKGGLQMGPMADIRELREPARDEHSDSLPNCKPLLQLGQHSVQL